jgi:hypothetical protein
LWGCSLGLERVKVTHVRVMHLPASTRDEIHSLGVSGRRRWADDGDDKAGDEVMSLGVRGRKKWALGSGEEVERLEMGG